MSEDCEYYNEYTGCSGMDSKKELLTQLMIEGEEPIFCKRFCCKDCTEKMCGVRCGKA